MRQIKNRHLEFLEEARQIFREKVLMETHSDNEKGLIALRYGGDRDCIWIYELGDEIGFFAQMIPETVGTEFIEAVGKAYDLKMAEVRTEVVEFVSEMERQLKANDSRGGWENCPHEYLISALDRNINKLETCTSHSEFRRRCANIANFAMMLSENDKREEKGHSV